MKGLYTMSKKKKKNKKLNNREMSIVSNLEALPFESKKSMNKKFENVIKDIEMYRLQLYEADKRSRRKERKKINKHEAEFYTSMEGLKCRKNMAKKWEKNGFLDKVISVLQQTVPIIATIAKIVGFLIISFLSIDAVKAAIKPKTLRKISNVFDIAMSI